MKKKTGSTYFRTISIGCLKPFLTGSLIQLLVLFYGSTLWAFQPSIGSQNLNSEELHRAQEAISAASDLLPSKMKAHLKRVHFRFENLEPRHNGYAKSGLVVINKNLLQESLQPLGFTTASKHPRQSQTILQSSLIHELSHLYDGLNVMSSEERNLLDSCRLDTDLVTADCQYIKSRTHSVSQNWDFLLSSGWLINPDQNALSQGNLLKFRSPDHYEFTNPKESFAVNMEFFLLDPYFKCRKPSLYRALKNILEHDPFSTVSCDEFSKHFFVSTSSKKIADNFIEVPQERLYQIHWLHASNGSSFVSKFGHSMLRLVICAPGKKPDETCLEDINHHLVLSFRASVEDNFASNIRGVKGDYPSILFVYPFINIRNEYNRDGFRSLESYPLKLTVEEMRDVLDTALETHWSYEGRYYFFSNNCAIETLNLLKKALGRSRLASAVSVRPDILLEQLKATDLLDQNKVLFHYSHQNIYENHLRKLKNLNVVPSELNLKGWISIAETERLKWALRMLNEGPQEAIGPFLAIEMRNASILHRTALAVVAAEIEEEAKKGDQLGKMDPEQKRLIAQKPALLAQLRSAGHLLGNQGYGRPTRGEVLGFLKSAAYKEVDQAVRMTFGTLSEQITHEMGGALKERLKTIYQILVELQSGFSTAQSSEKIFERSKFNTTKGDQNENN